MAEENQNNNQMGENKQENVPQKDSSEETMPQPEQASKKTWFTAVALAVLLILLILLALVWGIPELEELWKTPLMAIAVYASCTAAALFIIAFLVQRKYRKPHRAHLGYWLGLVLLALDGVWTWAIIRNMKADLKSSEAVAVYISAGIAAILIIAYIAWMRRAIRDWNRKQRERSQKKKKRFNPKPLVYMLCVVLLGVLAWLTYFALAKMKDDLGFQWNCPQALALYFAVGISASGIIVFIILMQRATTRWEMEVRLAKEHESWLVIFDWTHKILHGPTIICSFLAAFILCFSEGGLRIKDANDVNQDTTVVASGISQSETAPAVDVSQSATAPAPTSEVLQDAKVSKKEEASYTTLALVVGAIWFCVWLFCHTIEDYDFSFAVSLAMIFIVLLSVVLIVFGGAHYRIVECAKGIRIAASPTFYLAVGIAYSISIIVSYIRGLFYYVAITPNQMIIQSKIGEDGETIQRRRYDARVEAATDVIEWLVYNVGSLKIWFHDGRMAPMSFYVSGIRKKSQWLLDVLEVTTVEESS
ncbi:hypothetical protein ACFL5Z_02410 [Planctomycetota bacterium]